MFSKMKFVMDIDGTICPIKQPDQKYKDLVPYSAVVKKMKYYKENGATIILYTSRNVNTYKGNLGLINANTAKTLLVWLDKWEIPYDEIIYGKPWPGHEGFYVDDRSVRPDEFLKYTPEQLTIICNESRMEIK